ncbi:MAG TPA: hypothetical protein VGM39_08415, partial [Kofleriaceae bacterium]
HTASDITLTTPTDSLTFKNDGEDEELIPIVDRVQVLKNHRWLVLGWTSYGSGMQTEHAWLVDDTKGLKIIDKLAWTSDRFHSGIALDGSGSHIRIGIPLPRESSQDDVEGNGIHGYDEWELDFGSRKLDLPAVWALPTKYKDLDALPAFYTPPFDDSPSEHGWSGQFVWLTVGNKFVVRR